MLIVYMLDIQMTQTQQWRETFKHWTAETIPDWAVSHLDKETPCEIEIDVPEQEIIKPVEGLSDSAVSQEGAKLVRSLAEMWDVRINLALIPDDQFEVILGRMSAIEDTKQVRQIGHLMASWSWAITWGKCRRLHHYNSTYVKSFAN